MNEFLSGMELFVCSYVYLPMSVENEKLILSKLVPCTAEHQYKSQCLIQVFQILLKFLSLSIYIYIKLEN